MSKKRYSEDELDNEVSGIDGVQVDSKIDPKASIAITVAKTIRSSKLIQIGILAILMALAIAIVQGNVANIFGIEFKG